MVVLCKIAVQVLFPNAMETVDPAAKKAMLMHQYVETLRKMNDANDRGDAVSADRFFRCAQALCDRYMGRSAGTAMFS